MKKIIIYLGSLEHTWGKIGTWVFPLSVATVGSYAKSIYGEAVEIHLFKKPAALLAACRKRAPHIVGLSYYCWVKRLNTRVFDLIKTISPSTLTVGGGPEFTVLNATEELGRRFFQIHGSCDAFVIDSGELGFSNLISTYMDTGGDLHQIRSRMIDGCLVNDIAENDHTRVAPPAPSIKALGDIPSPYLSGMLDAFFEGPYIPIIETNRSCPYECTFCAWGKSEKKIYRYDTQRILAEVEYIAKRTKHTKVLEFADANFGIFKRDIEIAHKISECSKSYGYPGYVDVSWNKSRTDLLLQVMEEFNGLTKYCAATQSTNPDVLKEVKRRNLKQTDLLKFDQDLKARDMQMSTELILGLPLETRESHLEANRYFMDLGTEIFNYNLHLLPGTDLNNPEARKKYFRKTAWRLFDMSFGIYEGEPVFDAEEHVLETSTMSMEALRSFRLIHFLIQFMWSRKWYYDYLQIFRSIQVHPMDVILQVADRLKENEGEMGTVYQEFASDHDLELFDSYESLYEYWRQAENMKRLESGEYGKLNYLFTYRILLEHAEAFTGFLYETAEAIAARQAGIDSSLFLDQVSTILDFTASLRIDLQHDGALTNSWRRTLSYDLLSWRNSDYNETLNKGSFELEYFLPENQSELLLKMFGQYQSHSRNLTLRKMTEQIAPENMFYQVRMA